MSQKNDNIRIEGVRFEEQKKVMEQITEDGVCPFCEENLPKYHKAPILFKTKNWTVTENAWPYKMTKNHFLVISRDHIDHSSKISPEAWSEISEVVSKLEKEYGLEYGTLLMRFGDMYKTGATVKHLHFQLVQSDPEDPNYKEDEGLCIRVG